MSGHHSLPDVSESPLVIISTNGPSVLSSSLVPDPSQLLRTPVVASCDSMLVAQISSDRDVADVRQLLAKNIHARCLVQFSSGSSVCIMTLRDDGFVWNQDVFLSRHAGQYTSVAKRNPFLSRMYNSPHYSSDSSSLEQNVANSNDDSYERYDNDNDGGSEGDFMLLDNVAVHEIRI
ncbi:hypothetical protein GGI20_000162 [Coemansia sp. BCRC 34301]|nr:hypothetical protein GGI20_000162 [Coemansia sp. BCRC 34301]